MIHSEHPIGSQLVHTIVRFLWLIYVSREGNLFLLNLFRQQTTHQISFPDTVHHHRICRIFFYYSVCIFSSRKSLPFIEWNESYVNILSVMTYLACVYCSLICTHSKLLLISVSEFCIEALTSSIFNRSVPIHLWRPHSLFPNKTLKLHYSDNLTLINHDSLVC